MKNKFGRLNQKKKDLSPKNLKDGQYQMFKRKYSNNTTKIVGSEKIQLWWENIWLFFFK